jgi:phospholipase/carboxylesterase
VSLITNVVRGSNADRLLLLVHGFGADERDLGGLLPYLDPDGRFVTVLPRGPVALPGTPGFAWYDFGLPPVERAAAFAAAL